MLELAKIKALRTALALAATEKAMTQATTPEYSPSAKVYPTENLGKYSILDMLKYFEEHGAMRVSDLHIKVGAPPAYRIDGDLVKLKGPSVTPEIAKQLIFPLLKEHSLQKLQTEHSVDCSYRMGSLQFRINVFRDNDGLAAAIRALSLDVPDVEKIGFPNDVWQDIIDRKQGLVLLTGITGAGKSTTIASLIGRISEKTACRIITVEDPIEYILPQKYSIDLPAGGRPGRQVLPRRPQGDDAGGPGRHLRRRDARRRDHRHDAHGRRDRAPGLLHPAHAGRHRLGHPHPGLLPGGPAGGGPQPALAGPGLRDLPEADPAQGRAAAASSPWRSSTTTTPAPT